MEKGKGERGERRERGRKGGGEEGEETGTRDKRAGKKAPGREDQSDGRKAI